MSYSEWHTYGYGICVSDITDESVERLQKLISLAPEVLLYETKDKILAALAAGSALYAVWRSMQPRAGSACIQYG